MNFSLRTRREIGKHTSNVPEIDLLDYIPAEIGVDDFALFARRVYKVRQTQVTTIFSATGNMTEDG